MNIPNSKFLAVIPARGGSKRIPRKNLIDLCGKPLIDYTLQAAEASRHITKAILSSDDAEILTTAAAFAKIEALPRPEILAGDHSTTPDVLLHVLDVLQERGEHYDYLILLQPTSPLRTAAHIDAAIEQMIEKGAEGLISVTKADPSPLWCNILGENGDMSNFLSPALKTTRSQDLPDYYALNGCIFIADIERFRAEKSFFLPSKVTSYIMSARDSADIDTFHDLNYARFLLRSDLTQNQL